MKTTGWKIPTSVDANLWNFFEAFLFDATAFGMLCMLELFGQMWWFGLYLVFGLCGKHYRYRTDVMVGPHDAFSLPQEAKNFWHMIINDPRRKVNQ